ncbi:ATPase component of ABC transporters [Euzebya pacifica]|uniref:ATPase component of ABC transporters n=1 Tax=Euzebya pacifica TaxID=1608957 RepID=A0A346XTK6_9ACTN|nr:ABC-F family ATP-binding cassette domain-containing protein [Euzebya pacifica]AXV05553.1 ATPase component of ABC transporters [Euzebya pacifica]
MATNIVSLEAVTKSYAEKRPLDGINVGIDDGDRCGVIGINGSGKSTLLKIIAKVEPADSGRVVHRGGLRVRYLDQQPVLTPDLTPVEAAGGTREAEAYLDRLGLGGVTQPVGTLSGGQRRRVALAEVLADDPDLLILDEPTNHLDPDVIEWLEGLLTARSGSLLFVTHDRYLLGRLATRIIEVAEGEVFTHHGSYADYLEARAARQEQEQAEARKRSNLARVELEWLRRGPKARTSKAKHRVDKATDLVAAAAIKVEEREMSIDLPSRRLGSKVTNAHNAGKSFEDRTVLRDVELKVPPNARWGFVGPNGSGKSTLLAMLAGRMEPDEGSVRIGETVHIGWYGQDPTPMPPRTRVIDAVKEVAEEASTVDGLVVSAGDLLERFLFSKPAQRAYVEELSGGERRRLELLRVLADAPNLLILDEPTNDLDLDTLTVLEGYLDSWPGAMLVASHDRYFLDRVCDDLYAIRPDGTLRHQPGGWTAYREAQKAEAAALKAQRAAHEAAQREARSGDSSGSAGGNKPGKLTYNDKREFGQLGVEIPRLEKRRDELHLLLADAADDYEKAQVLSEELTAVMTRLDEAEMRWLELAERSEASS